MLSSFSESKKRDSRRLRPTPLGRRLPSTPLVSLIVLVFVGLREVSDLVVWTKATDRVETRETVQDRLEEVETEVKELREGLCWSFQVCCDWTCSLTGWVC